MPVVKDGFDRRIEYLRVSVTDRCNYRCTYCRPAGDVVGARTAELLSYEELARLVRLFSELGVNKVRLTGGEPLVRRDLPSFARMIADLPAITDLSLSTNGHLLDRHALSLRQAGVQRVNISLDSLDPMTFAGITRGGDLRRVVRGIAAARDAGLRPIKLNMVVMRGINDAEIERMIDFAASWELDLRFIETMPVGSAGRYSMAHFYPAAAILDRVRRHVGAELVPLASGRGAGPARCYGVHGGALTVGVISAVSQHFCASCNRVRLTARGELVLCLGQSDRVSLREALRAGLADTEMKDRLVQAIACKPARHDFSGLSGSAPQTPMSALGG